jgi:hypothetical protein
MQSRLFHAVYFLVADMALNVLALGVCAVSHVAREHIRQ